MMKLINTYQCVMCYAAATWLKYRWISTNQWEGV